MNGAVEGLVLLALLVDDVAAWTKNFLDLVWLCRSLVDGESQKLIVDDIQLPSRTSTGSCHVVIVIPLPCLPLLLTVDISLVTGALILANLPWVEVPPALFAVFSKSVLRGDLHYIEERQAG